MQIPTKHPQHKLFTSKHNLQRKQDINLKTCVRTQSSTTHDAHHQKMTSQPKALNKP